MNDFSGDTNLKSIKQITIEIRLENHQSLAKLFFDKSDRKHFLKPVKSMNFEYVGAHFCIDI